MEGDWEAKEEFHDLIDSIQDEMALQVHLELVRMLNGGKGQHVPFQDLSPEQRAGLLKSYEASFDENELVDHETVKSQFPKWL